MPYTNPAKWIEPYLQPYGKKIVGHIPQIQQEERAREQLKAQKSVWADKIAESQQNQKIKRDAQAQQLVLEGLARSNPEALQKLLGIEGDPKIALQLRNSGVTGPLQIQQKTTPKSVWKKRTVRNPVTGKLEEEHFNVNDPQARLKSEVPFVTIDINGKQMEVPEEVANRLKAQEDEEKREEKEWNQKQADKVKTQKIKRYEDKIEYAIKIGNGRMLKYYSDALDKEVGVSSGGMATDPEIDKARSYIMQARQHLQRYKKIITDAQEIPQQVTSGIKAANQPLPAQQYVIPPPKKETKQITWGEPYINKQGGLEQKSSTGQIKSIDKDPKNLKEISTWFKWHLGQYNSAKRGVGQYIKDPNKDQIAQDELGRAATMAKRYLEKGGNVEDLGLVTREIGNQIFIQVGPDEWMRIK